MSTNTENIAMLVGAAAEAARAAEIAHKRSRRAVKLALQGGASVRGLSRATGLTRRTIRRAGQ